MQLDRTLSAVVTGGASGLGRACAIGLAKAGVKVTIFDLNEEFGTKLAKEIDGEFIEVDVADTHSVANGFKFARTAFGQERLLFNCAGIAPTEKTISRGKAHTPEEFTLTININLVGTFNTCSQAAEGMSELGQLETGERGVIINTASIAAYDGQMGQIAYAASKAGIAGMTLPMARDLAKSGIRVMAIAPGIFETPMISSFPVELQERLGAQIPFPSRLGQPDEFAKLCLHICENEMLNGEVIRLDGAYRMPPK